MEPKQQIDASLSLIMPTYNESAIIETVIDGFHAHVLQYFTRPECIIVNDASTDATAASLERIRSRYPYVRVITHANNRGHGPSVRDALDAATGEYVLQCD